MKPRRFILSRADLLLATSAEVSEHWDEADLRAMLSHQLAAPLDRELSERLPDLRGAAMRGPDTIAEVLAMPDPPIESLEAVKELGKSLCRRSPGTALPRELGRVIYFAAIAAALVRQDVDITDLSDDDLRAGMRWCLKLRWLDDSTQTLLNLAGARLAEAERGDAPLPPT